MIPMRRDAVGLGALAPALPLAVRVHDFRAGLGVVDVHGAVGDGGISPREPEKPPMDGELLGPEVGASGQGPQQMGLPWMPQILVR